MRMVRLFILVIACFIVSPQVFAGEKIRVLTENFAPFNYPQDGEVIGISTTIVKAAFERAGVDYTIEVLPWNRAVMELDEIPNTFIYTMARTELRENKYIWVGKLFDRKVALFRHLERVDLKDVPFEELRYKTTICAVEGDASYELLRQKGFPEGSFIKVPGTAYGLCPKMVQEKRVDLTAYNPYALAYEVKSGKLRDVFVEQTILANEDGYYLAANPGSDLKLIEKLQRAFKELSDEGVNAKVAEEYLGLSH